MDVSEFEKFYAEGKTHLIATMRNGSKKSLRLFKSGDTLCYFGKGRSRCGFQIYRISQEVVSIKAKNSGANLSRYERYLDNLKKFKTAFTKKVHKNLWSGMQDSYARFDIDEFKKFVEAGGYDKTGEFYDALSEFTKDGNFDLMRENCYKATTIKSNAPIRSRWNSGGYYECIENIKRHLDNKEDFHYSWDSNYDVTVSGHTSKDGEYRATMSLEYRGCGNGHYYVLINENQAVFGEDD
jgi:hypothetical protein